VPVRGEDSDRIRYYATFRYGESNPITRAHDVTTTGLGLNLGRHLGFELAMDQYQMFLDVETARVADLSVRTFTPLVRLRYPLFDDTLTPYVIGGTGIALTQVNDSASPLIWADGNTDTRAATSVGLGIEYFLRDNIAFGAEGKYLILGSGEYQAKSTQQSLDLDVGLLTFGFRLYYPELHPSPEGSSPNRVHKCRFYGGLLTGGAMNPARPIFPGVISGPGQAIFGSRFTVLFGGFFGLDIGPYLGVEVTFANYKDTLALPNVGPIGKYTVFPVLIEPRLRYPLMNGRLEPYLRGGVGGEHAEPDKANEDALSEKVSATSLCVIGAIGAGAQYFVMDDIALAAEVKYVFSRGHTFQVGSRPPVTGDTDALMLTLSVRLYVFDF